MAIDLPQSDLSRSKQHEPSHAWPHEVKLAMHWKDAEGRIIVRTEVISSEQFFGEGSFGAPISGDFVLSLIERMRRAGPPKFKRNTNGRIRRGSRPKVEGGV